MELKGIKIIALALSVVLVAGGAYMLGKKSSGPDLPVTSGADVPPIPAVPQDAIDFRAQESNLIRIISENPGDATLLARLGDVYFEGRDYNSSAVQYKKALKINPSDIDSYNDLGLAYHYTGRTVEALNALKKGTGVDPTYQRIWLSYGYVLAASGNYPEAREALGKAASLGPDNTLGIEAKRIMASMP